MFRNANPTTTNLLRFGGELLLLLINKAIKSFIKMKAHIRMISSKGVRGKSTIGKARVNCMIPDKGIIDETKKPKVPGSTRKVKKVIGTMLKGLPNILRIILLLMVGL